MGDELDDWVAVVGTALVTPADVGPVVVSSSLSSPVLPPMLAVPEGAALSVAPPPVHPPARNAPNTQIA